MEAKSVKKFSLIRLLALCILVLAIMLVPTISVMSKNNEDEIIGQELWGEESELKGVLEVWNVDTFSGGTMGKADFLNSIARKFESENKGLYVCVKQLTIEEFKLAIAEGRYPAVISFGSGLGSLIKDKLLPLTIANTKIKTEVLNSGKVANNLLAVGYLMGGYAYFSTSEKLGLEVGQEIINLSDILYSSGKDVVIHKKQVHISSLNYGKSDYINPSKCLTGEMKDVLESVDAYEAYVDFISYNKSSILLGTQRDLVRLESRVENGKLADLIFEPVENYTDLVQYLGVISGNSELVEKYAKFFVEYLLSDYSQKSLVETGLFSVTQNNLYSGNFGKLESAVKNIKNVASAF